MSTVNLTGTIGSIADSVRADFNWEVKPTPNNPNYDGTFSGTVTIYFDNGNSNKTYHVSSTYSAVHQPSSGQICAYILAAPLTDDEESMKRIFASVFKQGGSMNLAGFWALPNFLTVEMNDVPTGVIIYNEDGGSRLPVSTRIIS